MREKIIEFGTGEEIEEELRLNEEEVNLFNEIADMIEDTTHYHALQLHPYHKQLISSKLLRWFSFIYFFNFQPFISLLSLSLFFNNQGFCFCFSCD